MPPTPAITPPENACSLIATRLGGYEYIKPLLFVDPDCESPELAPIKTAISQTIDAFKRNGDIISASVYVRVFAHGEWTGVNLDERYHPGSLFKVPILIAYLRMAETSPGLLDKSFVFEPPKDKVMPVQNYVSNSVKPGQKYTVRELLRHAVTYSDNNAYWLLTQHLDAKILENLFIDLGIGIPVPDATDGLIVTSARDYSAFMKTLFNSTYVTPELSEFGMSLMGECSFKEGFAKGLPQDVKVAHKFGEWDNTQTFELHESGVVYLQNKPCLITIMTKGADRSKLPPVISALTNTIYRRLNGD